MIHSDEKIPGENQQDQNKNIEKRGANPIENHAQNWNEEEIRAQNPQGTRPEFERSNLNPDREKRTGSNLSPDTNSGDR
ncbi:hypothetical protein [Flavobacterium sp. MK4S-17]|uniref:hypothetical protein n=1 Tax=Flavobacterium sp. MK4S-17 TaxID=2543737 RepID=UPI001359EB29|nr:hypothetical protein [Flavobacterium sp. MK4S-17]